MKKLKLMCIILIALFMITGCTTSKSYTYQVETGDTIKIQLDTTDGYDISSDLPFTISKDGETLSQGTFITIDQYNQYLEAIRQDSKVVILDSGSKDGIHYTFYAYDNSEYNYIIQIDDSNTGVLLGNPNSKEEAEACFTLISFHKDA